MRIQLLTLSILFTVFTSFTQASECNYKRTRVDLPENLKEIYNVANVASSHLGDETIYIFDKNRISAKDKRKVRTSQSPKYLNAVGSLEVTFENGDVYSCSANLVDTVEKRSSKILTSAEHCFRHKDDRRMAVKKIEWTATADDGTKIRKNAKLLNMEYRTDSAILVLESKVPFEKIKPLLLLEDIYMPGDEELGDVVDMWGSSATLAGHSADEYKGNNGKNLTYTDNLYFEDIEENYDNSGRKVAVVQATTYGGGSGGSLILRLTEESRGDYDLDPNGEQELLLGVTSTVGFVEPHNNEKVNENVNYLFKSGRSHGSYETNVMTFDRYLEDDYKRFFDLNN